MQPAAFHLVGLSLSVRLKCGPGQVPPPDGPPRAGHTTPGGLQWSAPERREASSQYSQEAAVEQLQEPEVKIYTTTNRIIAPLVLSQ
jgi:hypothetical protein